MISFTPISVACMQQVPKSEVLGFNDVPSLYRQSHSTVLAVNILANVGEAGTELLLLKLIFAWESTIHINCGVFLRGKKLNQWNLPVHNSCLFKMLTDLPLTTRWPLKTFFFTEIQVYN